MQGPAPLGGNMLVGSSGEPQVPDPCVGGGGGPQGASVVWVEAGVRMPFLLHPADQSQSWQVNRLSKSLSFLSQHHCAADTQRAK